MKSLISINSIEVVYIKSINLEWYRVFLHTARHGNFSKAAHALHMTQPSISYAIKQIEETLGITLFHRLPKGVELTEEGRSLLAYVEQSFSLLDAAEQHVLELKQLTEGAVRVGASDSLIKHMLLPQLNLFHARYPGVRIRLSHGRTPDIAARLRDGTIDLALLHLPLEDDMLDITELATHESCFVAGNRYRDLAERPLSMQELAELPHLLLSPGSSTRTFVEQWYAASGLSVVPDIELGSIDLLIEFAKMGYGVAFLARTFAEEELRAGRLWELRPDKPLPPQRIGLAVRRGMRLPLAAERFAAMLKP